jgi:hypothetical protein
MVSDRNGSQAGRKLEVRHGAAVEAQEDAH